MRTALWMTTLVGTLACGAFATPPPSPLEMLSPPPADTPAAPVALKSDWERMTMDDLVAALPPVGAEWRWDHEGGGGIEHPASAEMDRRLRAGAVLSDEQWRAVLQGTGAIVVRTRWPAGEPFAVSMDVPRWLGTTQIRLHSRGEKRMAAEAGELWWSPSGTMPARRAAAAKYQRLVKLEPGHHEITFDVTVERGKGPPIRRSPPNPAPGVMWKGELRYEVEVVPTIDDAIPPVAGAELDHAVRDAIGAGVRQWHYEGVKTPTFFVVVDPDVACHPPLAHTGLSLEVEVLRDGEVIDTGPMLAARNDSLALANSVSTAPLKFYGSQNFRKVPADIVDDPDELARWSLRVRGTNRHILYIWEATQRWGGELTIPLADAIGNERERTGPGGRGPEVSTPSMR